MNAARPTATRPPAVNRPLTLPAAPVAAAGAEVETVGEGVERRVVLFADTSGVVEGTAPEMAPSTINVGIARCDTVEVPASVTVVVTCAPLVRHSTAVTEKVAFSAARYGEALLNWTWPPWSPDLYAVHVTELSSTSIAALIVSLLA